MVARLLCTQKVAGSSPVSSCCQWGRGAAKASCSQKHRTSGSTPGRLHTSSTAKLPSCHLRSAMSIDNAFPLNYITCIDFVRSAWE
jgi:hypothetical protein